MITVIQPEYLQLTDDQLGSKLREAVGSEQKATIFWNPLTHFAVNLVNSGGYYQARGYLLELLRRCKRVSIDSFVEVHKGNPYYWLGIATYMLDDFQTAMFFFDAAASEDFRYGRDVSRDPTPAMLFLTLDSRRTKQAALQLVRFTEEKIKRSFEIYHPMLGRPAGTPDLTISDLQRKFLIPALSSGKSEQKTLVTTFLSFFIEWDYRNDFFDVRPGKGSAETFFLHLFKGCVLFESLLKQKVDEKTLWPALTNKVIKKKLGFSGKPETQEWTFHNVLKALDNSDNHIETAIRFTYRVRNTVGHNLSWNIDIEKDQYQRLFGMISSSCLHAITCLY